MLPPRFIISIGIEKIKNIPNQQIIYLRNLKYKLTPVPNLFKSLFADDIQNLKKTNFKCFFTNDSQ